MSDILEENEQLRAELEIATRERDAAIMKKLDYIDAALIAEREAKKLEGLRYCENQERMRYREENGVLRDLLIRMRSDSGFQKIEHYFAQIDKVLGT